MIYRNFKELLVELILLAVLVGFVPELFVGATVDLFGPCGFDSQICADIQIMGAVKSVLAFLCVLAAVVVSFLLSKEFNFSSSDEGG